LGRETLDQVFADIMGAEAAVVRVQFVSGTHAIACALFGVLRPGDEMLSVAGAPYDTLEEVIGTRGKGQGSLKEFGVKYRELALQRDGSIDWDTLGHSVTSDTRLVLIQRSCGYSWRSSLSIAEIERIVQIVKQQNPHTVCFVDNCYGEFIEDREPPAVGADLIAGSLNNCHGWRLCGGEGRFSRNGGLSADCSGDRVFGWCYLRPKSVVISRLISRAANRGRSDEGKSFNCLCF
jgi:cystathionine beta-lyase family protein involved in aluminum resistance